MPRYVVAREFPNGLEIPINPAAAEACREVIGLNLEEKVRWVETFISVDKKRTYCIYDAPTPEAIRRAGIPVDAITEVSMLSPHFYIGEKR